MAKVPLVSREELPEDKQHIYDSIAGTRGSVLNVFRVLLNSPDAAEAAGDLGAYLRYRSPLDAAVREIAILTVARELNVAYEWTHHEPVARDAGVREEVIESIRSGRAPMGLPAKEGVFAQAAKELVRNRTLTDRTYQAVEHLIGPAQTVDLIVLVGYYSLLAGVINTLDVELDVGTSAELGGCPLSFPPEEALH